MRVLILCTGNSARSQMAEGLMRHYGGGRVEVFSAGTHPKGVHPLSIRVMREIGIDISHHESKSLDRFLNQRFDYVITVCDRANESCPLFPGNPRRVHWSISDPAAVVGSNEEQLHAFRAAQEELAQRIKSFVDLHMPKNQS